MLSHYQFIIPDLPGFGKSNHYPIAIYNLTNTQEQLSKARVLHDFLLRLKVNNHINIAGNSLGGLVGSIYAMEYPDEIQTLAYIGSPAGYVDFSPVLINKTLRQGYNPIVPTTLNSLMIKYSLLAVNYKKIMPSVPYMQRNILPRLRNNSARDQLIYSMTNQPVYSHMLAKPIGLNNPVLMLWGKQGYVFGKPYHAYQLARSFIYSHHVYVKIIDQAGHLMPQEKALVVQHVSHDYFQFIYCFN